MPELTAPKRHADTALGRHVRVRLGAWVVLPLALLFGMVQAPTVPDLVGLTVADAQEGGVETGSSFVVSDQRPAAGALVAFDEAVSLALVVVPPEQVEVPNLVGSELRAAEAELTAVGLELSIPDNAPEGIVQSQDPAAGELVAPDTVVVVTVAEAGVVVPDVVRSNVEDARTLLAGLGLQLSGPDAGVVASQDPPPGVTVERGGVVDIEVGPPPDLVEVPNLVGLTATQARDRLTDLVLGPVPSDEPIIGQDPGVGELVPPGSTVNVSVREAPQVDEVVVPTVVGLSLEEVRIALDRTGLATEADSEDGSVVGQSPPAGTLVPRGTVVSVVLSAALGEDSESGVVDDGSWALWGLGLPGAAAAALVGSRMARRRGRTWASRSVRVRALPSQPHVAAAAPHVPAVAIRLVPRATSRTTYSMRKHR